MLAFNFRDVELSDFNPDKINHLQYYNEMQSSEMCWPV